MAADPHVSSTPPLASETAAGLVRRLVDDLSTLMRKELALARAEVARSVHDAKTGVAAVLIGGMVLYAGLLVLLFAAVLALALVLPAWGAALVVGGVTAVIGLILLGTARRKLSASNLKPEYTQESLRRNREVFQRRTV